MLLYLFTLLWLVNPSMFTVDAQAPLDTARRRLLIASASLVPSVSIGQGIQQDPMFWSAPRRVRIERRFASGVERVDAVYFADGQLVESGYLQLCRILRDERSGTIATMSLRLLDSLCGMQGYLAGFGMELPWTATSGYRTPQSNAAIEGAALNSEHLKGNATDGRILGLKQEWVGKLSQWYTRGGLGFYVLSDRLHIDGGRLREWRSAK